MVAASLLLGGCAEAYKGVVKPVARMSVLSPELENLSDAKIETYLKGDARPVFPCALAVAKLAGPSGEYDRHYHAGTPEPVLQVLSGEEAEGWRQLTSLKVNGKDEVIERVHFINMLLVGGKLSLKGLRDAAALVHAPILLAYMEVNSHEEGQNPNAMAYWTLIGLFTVPGNTVGHCTVCQAVLVDTRSGFILATAEGEAMREETCLPGAVDIAGPRTAKQARAAAVARLESEVREALAALARRGTASQP